MYLPDGTYLPYDRCPMATVANLLEVSRITSGRIQLHREQTSVRDLVERAVETTRPALQQRQHELTVTLPEEVLWLEVDPARMEQVLTATMSSASARLGHRGSG